MIGTARALGHTDLSGEFCPDIRYLGRAFFSGQLTSQLSKTNNSSFIGWYKD